MTAAPPLHQALHRAPRLKQATPGERPEREGANPRDRPTQRGITAGPVGAALTFLDILSLLPSPGTTSERPEEPRTDSRPQPRPPPQGSPGPPASEPLPARGSTAVHAGTRSCRLGKWRPPRRARGKVGDVVQRSGRGRQEVRQQPPAGREGASGGGRS